MNEFRKKIEKRKNILMIVTGLLLLLNVVLFFLDGQYSRVSHKIEEGISFQMGLIIGIGLLAIVGVYKYSHILKDDDALKKMCIKEHDERNTMIKQKMAMGVLVTCIIGIIIGISVSAYFEPIVAITLLVELYVLIIIILIFKIYYRRKY